MKEYRSQISKAIIIACEEIGPVMNLGHLWAEAVDHLSNEPEAIDRMSSVAKASDNLEQAISKYHQVFHRYNSSSAVEKRDALTFLAASAVWAALDGIRRGVVAKHEDESPPSEAAS
jgi:hypothetical protein